MAEIAIGTNCGGCGTLVAVSGKRSDQELYGQCPVCKTSVARSNPEYTEPPWAVEKAKLESQVEAVVNSKTDLQSRIDALEQQLAAKQQQDPEPDTRDRAAPAGT
jgi:hypothetical protein